MAILPILTYPNPKLREVSQTVESVSAEHKQLALDMIATMYDANGIGLAAPQVDRLIRLLVIDIRIKDEQGAFELTNMSDLEKKVPYPLILFNPTIVKQEGLTKYDEGCLSVPGYYESVERYQYIEVAALNENNEKILVKTDGLLAICIQHEMDHLEGKLFIDHISFVKSNKIKNQIKKYGYQSKEELQKNRDARKKEKMEI